MYEYCSAGPTAPIILLLAVYYQTLWGTYVVMTRLLRMSFMIDPDCCYFIAHHTESRSSRSFESFFFLFFLHCIYF